MILSNSKYKIDKVRIRWEPFLNSYIGVYPKRLGQNARIFSPLTVLLLDAIEKNKNENINEIIAKLSKDNSLNKDVFSDIEPFLNEMLNHGAIVKNDNKDDVRTYFINVNPKTGKSESNRYFKPTNTQISINSECNLRCKHCYTTDNSSIEKAISLEKWKKLIDILFVNGVLLLEIVGGEPLLHKNICKFIDYAYEKNFTIRLFSNLQANNTDILDNIIAKCSIFTTLHGACEYHDNFVRKKGAFNQTIKNIKYIKYNNGVVGIGTPINNENISYIDDIKNIAEENKCFYLPLPILPSGRFHDFFPKYEIDNYFNLYNNILIYRPGLKNYVANNPDKYVKILPKGFECSAGRYFLFISSSGDIFPCPLFANDNFNIGNIFNDNELQCWDKSEILKLFYESGADVESDCKKCKNEECLYWCKLIIYKLTGSVKGPPSYCPKYLTKKN